MNHKLKLCFYKAAALCLLPGGVFMSLAYLAYSKPLRKEVKTFHHHYVNILKHDFKDAESFFVDNK